MITGRMAYWRFKNDKAWMKAWIEILGNGLVSIQSRSYGAIEPTILSENEIEIKYLDEKPQSPQDTNQGEPK